MAACGCSQVSRLRLTVFLVLVAVTSFSTSAFSAGPRWVAGPSWTNNARIMNWYRSDVQYYVDPGPLSASVDHATAVALVDAAASVWTVSGIPFSLTNGGSLDEDVSGDNVYLGANGPVWPADVQSSNYTAKQVAVVFDADGAITDTLLGSGASAPANCRTAAVTETVDLFVQPGKIAHAIVIVNGQCTGPAPEQQLQLRYQLMRAFGRVIGLGWSQLNDNVFTGTPAPTYQDQMHWPLMHPVDILCGPYSYQCLPQPFTLREDDVASLALVNAPQITQGSPDWVGVEAWLRFPNGQGMNGVNVVAHRNWPNGNYGTEEFGIVSGVSGAFSPEDIGNPVTGPPLDTDEKQGSSGGYGPGFFAIYGVPAFKQFEYTSLIVSTEAINPLYTGQYAVGPYRAGSVAPAGDSTWYFYFGNKPGYITGGNNLTPDNAPYQCATGTDGTENAPVALPTGGVWSGLFCGVGHTAWTSLSVRAGRTATIEATALDTAEAATTSKAMPVIGLWHAADAIGTTPTLARTAAFNAAHVGMTQLRAAFSVDEQLRLALADQRGDGRPDYLYRARVLYADSVSPSRVPPAGGTIRIVGTGFQPGCTVTVGGVVATITSQSATEIDAVAPTLTSLHGTSVNDVTITDLRTGGTTVITAGLTYDGAAGDVLSLVTAPPATVATGASVVFAVRLVDGAGSPVPNGTITVSASGVQTLFDACGLSTCTLLTDSSGVAQTRLTPQAAGTVTLQAAAKSGSTVQASFVAVAMVQAVVLRRPTQYVAAAAGAIFHPEAQVTGSSGIQAAQSLAWSASSPRITLTAVHTSGAVSRVDAVGTLRESEAATVQACTPDGICATESVVGVPAADLRVVAVAGDGQSVASATALQPVTVRVTDVSGHPVAGASASVYQRVTGQQPPCTMPGRCAVAPVYGTSTFTAISDDDGLLTIQPLQYSATAASTQVTIAVGTAGTLTVLLQKTP